MDFSLQIEVEEENKIWLEDLLNMLFKEAPKYDFMWEYKLGETDSEDRYELTIWTSGPVNLKEISNKLISAIC